MIWVCGQVKNGIGQSLQGRGGCGDLQSTKLGEYFAGRGYVTTEPDEKMVPYVFEHVGDVVCYSSDYCHWDCDFPDSVKLLEERGDLDDAMKKVAGGLACCALAIGTLTTPQAAFAADIGAGE